MEDNGERSRKRPKFIAPSHNHSQQQYKIPGNTMGPGGPAFIMDATPVPVPDRERDRPSPSSYNYELSNVMDERNMDMTRCARCNDPLSRDSNNILFNGRLLHAQCFVCVICHEPLEGSYLQKDDVPYCERDYVKMMPHMEPLPEDCAFHFLSQPAEFQIANYNIHPPPALSVEGELSANVTIYIHLVESTSKLVVNGGFQSGDVRVLRAGQSEIYFTGLKLNKMGPIKHELNFRNSRQLNSNFCVRFNIGSTNLYTNPFKLVSSCSQLSQDVRENVRPLKKMPPRNSRSSEQEEDSASPPEQENFIFFKGNDLEEETKHARLTLENAIEKGEVDAAGKAAQKLALLHKLRLRPENRDSPSHSP